MPQKQQTQAVQGAYSGVPSSSTAAEGGVPVVATAVASSGKNEDAIPLAGNATRFEIGDDARGDGHGHDLSLHEEEGGASGGIGGTIIETDWTKGEVQPPAYRDKWFAVAFLVHLVAILATAFALGPKAFQDALSPEASGTRRLASFFDAKGNSGARSLDESENWSSTWVDTDDETVNSPYASSYSSSSSSSGSGYDSSGGDELPPPPDGLIPTILLISAIAAPVLSILALSVMSANATKLLQFSLLFGIGLNVALFVVTLLLGIIPSAMIHAIFAAILACYAKSVWHRIPYAAANLRAAIAAVRSNLGVAMVAFGAVPVLVTWSVAWFVALFGAMDTDFMKAQVEEVPASSSSSYYNDDWSSGGATEEEISPLGGFVICLFLLSFYWTHQVIKNSVRTTVAGTIGTWWFEPPAQSTSPSSCFCCTKAVWDSYVRSNTYSLGSICFGSLIVAVLHLLRNMLRSTANNRRAGIFRCIAACILLYLERLVEYFNKWAFVYVGLYGYGYVEAGKKVMELFKARGWSTIISDNLVNRMLSVVVLAIGLVVGLVTFLTTLVFEEFEGMQGWLGLGFFIGFLVGILMSSVMMGVLSSSVDAIIVCFAEAPDEFRDYHPELAKEMESAWAAAWPDMGFRGVAVVSLGGGLGIV